MIVRATAVCIKEDSLLLVHQNIKDMKTFWSLPGGKVEEGETIHGALIREVKEETGLDIKPIKLLYLTQRFTKTKHVIQVLFLVDYVSGGIGKNTNHTKSEKIFEVKFVNIKELENYGISKKFSDLVRNEFADSGKYADSISDLGL